MNALTTVLRAKPLVRAARLASDYVDLQWSLTIRALERAAPSVSGRMIDVGCGEKPYAHLFAAYVTEHIGVERQDTFAQTSALSRGTGPDVLYDGETLPFPDESFDSALNVQVLEHTPRPLELLAEITRVLKKDGVLVLMAPFSFRLHEEPHDYFRYTPHGLRSLCERVGLEIVSVEPMGTLWTVIGHKLNTYFALSVARMGSVAQSLNKLGHESVATAAPRLWTLPIVAPAMVCVAASSRLLDQLIPEPTETLSFIVIAKRVR